MFQKFRALSESVSASSERPTIFEGDCRCLGCLRVGRLSPTLRYVSRSPFFGTRGIRRLSKREPPIMRKFLSLSLSLTATLLIVSGCQWLSRHNISGVWKGSIESTERTGHWQGPAELALNQNANTITGTLAFTHPQAGRIQVPISSGVVDGDSVTLSGQAQLPMGSVEFSFHGRLDGKSLKGTADMTLRALLLGSETTPASLNLTRQ